MKKPKFDFASYNIDIDVAGHTFMLECSTETAEYLGTVSADLRGMIKDIAEGKELNTAVSDYCENVIDRLLGKGATEKIFTGRRKNVDDLTDVLMFLSKTIGSFQQERKAARGKPFTVLKNNGK